MAAEMQDTEEILDRMLKILNEDGESSCEHEKTKFSTPQTTVNKTKNQERESKCHLCLKSFYSRSNLKKHNIKSICSHNANTSRKRHGK